MLRLSGTLDKQRLWSARELRASLTFVLFLFGCIAVAQEQKVPTTQERPKELQDPPKKAIDAIKAQPPVEDDSRTRHYLTLTTGLEHEEKLDKLPEGFKIQGDYDKYATQSYDANLGVLRINPTNTGVGTLTIHDKDGKLLFEYRLDVRKSNLDKVARELKSLIGDIEGIQIRIINNRVVVDGQILLPRDISRIGSAVLQFGDLAVSLVSLSPLAQKKIAEIIEREINNPEVSVRAVNERFLLEGVVDNAEEKERAVKIANIYLPSIVLDPAEDKFIRRRPKQEPIIDMIQVRPAAPRPPEKLIQLVVHYVELNKDYNRLFRFQWMPDLKDGSGIAYGGGNNSSAGGVFSQITGIISNLFPKLNFLKSHGFARILQSSTLIVENAQKGEMNSFQKVPYSSVSATGQPTTAFQPVGITTQITPTIVPANSDSIRLDLGFAISQLIGTTDAGPQTSEHNIHTFITVRSGQSAAVGGVITNSTSNGYNRLPADVSKNPILSLYSSKDFQRKQTQFVIFVTPIIKTSASAGVEKIKRKFQLRD